MIIHSSMIQLGVRFRETVYFEDGKNMFLGAGKSAKAFHVSALKRWDIPFLVTAGTLLDEIAEEDDGIEELEPLDDDEPAELEEI